MDKTITIVLPKGYMNAGVGIKNNTLFADTNDSANWDEMSVQLPEPKGKWSIKNKSGKTLTLIDKQEESLVKEERPINYWDADETEILNYSDKEEAIQGILSMMTEEERPETLEICGYSPMIASYPGSESLVENILEHLDEDFGDPDGEPTEVTEVMVKAADEFVDKILAEYKPWAHEITKRETVNVAEWLKAYGEML